MNLRNWFDLGEKVSVRCSIRHMLVFVRIVCIARLKILRFHRSVEVDDDDDDDMIWLISSSKKKKKILLIIL